MLSSQAARLQARGCAQARAVFPATIIISGKTFVASTSGRASADALAPGGSEADRRISFGVPIAKFTAVGATIPSAQTTVTCTAPAALAGSYWISEVTVDALAINVTLRCVEGGQ